MPELQTTYSETVAAGYPGMVADGETSNRISLSIETSTGIGFGKAVYTGSGGNGCLAAQTLTGSSAVAGTNTGNGTVSAIVVTEEEGAMPGVYDVVFIEPTTNLGTFIVNDPNGELVGDGVVGTEFDVGGITFTISDGSTDFVAGDRFAITVAGNKFVGISIANAALGLAPGETADLYQRYDAVDIMVSGAIYVEAGETVARGAAVLVDADGNFVDSAGIPCPGWIFDQAGSDGDAVRIVRR